MLQHKEYKVAASWLLRKMHVQSWEIHNYPCCKSLIKPQMSPPFHSYQIAKPLMSHFMRCRDCHLIRKRKAVENTNYHVLQIRNFKKKNNEKQTNISKKNKGFIFLEAEAAISLRKILQLMNCKSKLKTHNMWLTICFRLAVDVFSL